MDHLKSGKERSMERRREKWNPTAEEGIYLRSFITGLHHIVVCALFPRE